MQRTLEKVITNHKKGVFLFDPPTGFGKTTIDDNSTLNH